MPLRIAAMPCSRIPKCRVLPYGLPGYSRVWCCTGMNDGSPSIVVSLLPARSAEPPQSSGSTPESAFSIFPDALRVASPFGSGWKSGSVSAQPSGGQPVQRAALHRAPGGPGRERLVPRRPQPLAALGDLAGVGHRLVLGGEPDLGVEAEDLLGRRDLGGAE